MRDSLAKDIRPQSPPSATLFRKTSRDVELSRCITRKVALHREGDITICW